MKLQSSLGKLERPHCSPSLESCSNGQTIQSKFPTAGPVGFQSLGLGLQPGDLQPSKSGMEPWNPGTQEPWNPGTLQLGTSEPWNFGTSEPRNPETLKPWTLELWWNFWNPGTGTLEPWNLGTLKLWWNFWNPGTLQPWNLKTLEPWNLGTLEPWNLGSLLAGPGALDPRTPGALEL